MLQDLLPVVPRFQVMFVLFADSLWEVIFQILPNLLFACLVSVDVDARGKAADISLACFDLGRSEERSKAARLCFRRMPRLLDTRELATERE